MYLSYLLTRTIFNFSNMEKKKGEIMPVKTVTSPSSAPQMTFRQATRRVSNENGLCQARHMARVEANFLVHASLPCLVK